MVHIEESTVLNLPVGDVFAFVADQNNAPAWQKGLLRVQKTTEGPIGVGTTHVFERKLMGRKTTATNVYTQYSPDDIVAFKSTSGPVQFHASYTTTAGGSGTKLTCRMEIESGRGLSGLMLPLIAMSINKEMKANLLTLKALLEDTNRQR
ncbi:SRPBCC family protein [Paenarthrobacter sp. PH39-S1]|uniref:SRPBCC family protein n=1 Tax=Paenarthrobacter sp. PH39-S1 TaxID=3046204 RepID=UPI0024B9B246|nr:SRPBCC family protein [Paenarthrobacter sp. PH39-S1]MDJ0355707.1 SRPBCC family protein [Paenarthrobacter sp. PH39-S1]